MLEGLSLSTLLGLWLVFASLCVWIRVGRGRPSSGLVVVWVVGSWLLNWLPTYVQVHTDGGAPPPDLVDGFPVCVVAIGAGLFGIILAEMISFSPALHLPIERDLRRQEVIAYRIGIVAYVSTTFGILRFPTFTAIFGTAANLLVVLVAWSLRRALGRGWSVVAAAWLAATLGFPLFTTMVAGFIGYGALSSLIVLCHQVALPRRRLWMLPVGLMALYLSLSVYVTYMRDRDAIRGQVWGGQPFAARVEGLVDTFSRFEFVSFNNQFHEKLIVARLDQVSFVGAARRNLDLGIVDYARGETFLNALVALVPRVIWPEKPVSAGSGNLVTRFTGQQFAEGTSVGVTQVLEGYINFGVPGVAVLFVGLGFLLGRADQLAGTSLARNDLSGFLGSTLPHLALLNVGGSMVETSVSFVSGYIVIWAMRKGGVLSSAKGRGSNRGNRTTVPAQAGSASDAGTIS